MNFFLIALAALLLPALLCAAAWGSLSLLRRLRVRETRPRPQPVRRSISVVARARVTELGLDEQANPAYTYDDGVSDGFPEIWESDLLLRRN